MCRLMAVAAAEPIPVRHALVDALDSLQNQSARNMDGWGIAWYDEDGHPRLVKDFMPAALSSVYEEIAESVLTRRLVAHVRAATKGGRGLPNTHPFRIGRWVFAHNGTVRGIEEFRDDLEATLPPELRDHLKGGTDSELVFHLIAARAGLHRDGAVDGARIVEAIRETVLELARRSEGLGDKPTTLNTVLTDGDTMYVTRWGKGLWLRRSGSSEGAFTVLPRALAATVPPRIDISSQPFTFDYAWREVPDRSLAVISSGLEVRHVELQAVA